MEAYHGLTLTFWVSFFDMLLERHGKRSYERCPPPTPPSTGSSGDNGTEFETHTSRARSVSSSVTPADLPSMAFSAGSDVFPPGDLIGFSDADSFAGQDVDPSLFTLISTATPQGSSSLDESSLSGGRGDISNSSHHHHHPGFPGDDHHHTLDSQAASASQTVDTSHSPLHMAVRRGSAKIVSLLLKHGADCNAPDRAGLSPLMHASIGGHVEIVDMLLAGGATMTCADEQQQSPLHWAVMHRREALLKSLLKHCGSNSRSSNQIINAYNLDGQTPLHMAIELGFETAVEELLHSGADVRCAVRGPQGTSLASD